MSYQFVSALEKELRARFEKFPAGLSISLERCPAILNRILSLKTQNFAVKLNSENRFTFAKKNSECTA